MEEIAAEKFVYDKNEQVLVSTSCGFPAGSRPTEIPCADGKLAGNKCNHFSIRGYVAEIREIDRTICWPFVVHDNHTKVEEIANSLPPLSVTEFRWWGCENCLQKTAIKEASAEKRVIRNCSEEKMKTNLPTKERISEAIVLSPDSILLSPTTEADIRDCSHSCSKDINTKHTSRGDSNGKEENPDKVTDGMTSGKTKVGLSQRGEEISREAKKTKNGLETNQPGNLSVFEMESTPDCVVVDRNASEIKVNELEGRTLDAFSKQEHQTREADNGVIGIEISSSICNGTGNVNHMEEMRSYLSNLDLGIQNDEAVSPNSDPTSELRPMSLDDPSIDFDSKDHKNLLEKRNHEQNGVYQRDSDTENSGGPQGVGVFHLNGSFHRKKAQKIRLLSDIMSSEVVSLCEEEEIFKGGLESKHIDIAVDSSKSAHDASIKIDLDHDIKSDVANGQGDRKTNVEKKRIKDTRVENDSAPLINWLKVPSYKSNHCSITGFQQYQKVSKNRSDRRSKKARENGQRKHEETTLDEVPMDIVELMAKNQQERLQLGSENGNRSRYPLAETCGTQNGPNITNLSKILQYGVSSSLLDDSPSDKKSQFSVVGRDVAIKNSDKTASYEQLNMHSKYKRGCLSINQSEQQLCISTVFSVREKPSSKAQFPVTGSTKNGISDERKMLGSKWSPTCLQTLEAYSINRDLPNETLCNRGGSPILSNSMGFGLHGNHKVNAKSCHMSTLSNCPNPQQELKGKLNTITHGSHGLKSLRPNWKGKVASRTHRRAHRSFASDFTKKGNNHHVKTPGQSDLYTKDTMSAMSLLRLMDQGAFSSTPINMLMSETQEKCFNPPQFSNDHNHRLFFGLEDSLIKAQPVSFEYLERDCCLGSSTEPIPPIPKFGAFGSSSKVKTSTTDSHIWRRPINFMDQCSTEVLDTIDKVVSSSPKFHEEKKNSLDSPNKSVRSPRPNGHSDKRNKPLPVKHVKKTSQSASDSMKFYKQQHKKVESTTNVQLAISNKNGRAVEITKNSCTVEICTVNRNPAEIDIQEAESFYVIRSKDPKFRKICPSSERFNSDGRKRQRMMKLTAIGHLRECDIS